LEAGPIFPGAGLQQLDFVLGEAVVGKIEMDSSPCGFNGSPLEKRQSAFRDRPKLIGSGIPV
jgi:hypothetical protein